jgi:hypothetical protein
MEYFIENVDWGQIDPIHAKMYAKNLMHPRVK